MNGFFARNWIVSFAAAVSLAACSGGGAGQPGDAGNPPTVPTEPPVAVGPYTGAASAVPGSFEAEDFDLGGEGVAYHDSDTGNAAGAYRPNEDVDIEATSDSDGGNYDVSKFQGGEWLSYSIDVAATDEYLLELRVRTSSDSASLNVQLDGQDLTGIVSLPNTGNAYRWVGRANVALEAGEHTLTIQSDRGNVRLNRVRITPMPAAGPYLGAAFSVPAEFEAEDFDIGGEGAAYHDETPGNAGGAYRAAEDVDIAATGDSNGSYDVTDFTAGEWLSYTISVADAGNYAISLRASSDAAGAAYRLALGGQELAGPIAVPDGGSYAWTGPESVALPAGEHTLTVSVDSARLRVNTLRIEAAEPPAPPPPPAGEGSTPYLGAPVAVPGLIEAEDFDLGGQGVAYHDTAAGNVAGAYRPDEDVDIAPTTDSEGGEFEIQHFETGEWLSYSIDVAQAGNYDIELRVSSAFADSSYRIEIDDQDVTGPVAVPNTGDWNSYRWVVSRDIALSAGKHVLKVYSEKPYFGLNSIRISDEAPEQTPPPSPGGDSKLIFSSGFEGNIEMLPLVDCWGTGCWQDIAGLDALTNFNWPISVGQGAGRFLMLTDPANTTPLTMGDYMFNRIEQTSGPRGKQSGVLYQEISKNANGTEPMGTSPASNQFQILPKQDVGELYVSFWVKLQPDLVEKMNNLPAGPGINNGGTWRAFFALKTGSQNSWGGPADDGDYRVETYIMTYGGGQPYWAVVGDNNAGGGAPRVNSWNAENRQVPVPVGKWFKFEIYWKRSNGSDGRVWIAADGQVLADRHGPNMGAWNMPINRIMAPLLYSGSRMPIYQWIDDIEVWDGFPVEGANTPYAAH